jgi:excisionase family DNA binding protein
MAANQPEGRWMNVRKAAAYAGVSTDCIYKACNTGQLRHARIGGNRVLRFLSEWVDAWIGEVPTAATIAAIKGDTSNGALQAV